GPGGVAGSGVDLAAGLGQTAERDDQQQEEQEQRGHKDQLDGGAAVVAVPAHGVVAVGAGRNRSTLLAATAWTGRCRPGMRAVAEPETSTLAWSASRVA